MEKFPPLYNYNNVISPYCLHIDPASLPDPHILTDPRSILTLITAIHPAGTIFKL